MNPQIKKEFKMTQKQRPQPKRELAVLQFIHTPKVGTRSIYFAATQEAMEDVKKFGLVSAGIGKDGYLLTVDPRYDFEEVLSYLEHYDDDDTLGFLQEGTESA
jgi:hypothetical protein